MLGETDDATAAGDDARRGAQRAALGNIALVRHVGAHLLAATAEWSVFIGVLVYAFDRGGASATGLSSVALLVPYIVCSPVSGALAERYRPNRVRIAGLLVQTLGYGIGAAAAFADLPTVWVVVPCMAAVGALTTLRPSGAVLLPAIVRSTRELTVGNLWTGYAENTAALAGPLLATGMLIVGGSPAVVAGCAACSLAAAAATSLPRPIDPPGGSSTTDRRSPLGSMRRNLAELRSRPGVLGVLVVAGAQYFVIGAFDIILVVAAEDRLGLGESGPGVLLTVLGVGALLGGGATTALVRRERLTPVLMGAMLAIAVLAAVLGVTLSVVAAFVLLPLIGLARSVIDMIADVLLHRSAPPDVLASVYAVIEISSGVGLLLGSIGAQALIAVSGVGAAFLGTAGFFVVLLVATIGALRRADTAADVPVVSMSLVRQLPVFAALPRAELETLCRSGVEVATRPGDVIIAEGESGDRFYAVASGAFEVSVAGVPVHEARRGQGFGEIALLADVPRTATVTSIGDGLVLAIDRAPFLIAVTGHDTTRQAAWGVVHRVSADNLHRSNPTGAATDGDPIDG